MRNVINAFIAVAVLIVAMGATEARNTEFVLGPGSSFTIRCTGTALTDNSNPRSVVYRCVGDQKPPGGGKPPPSDECGEPAPAVAQRKRLTAGQTIYTLSNMTTAIRFNSSIADKSVNFSWGPFSSGGPKVTAITVSQCEGDFDVQSLPRTCWSNANTGQFGISTRSGTKLCRLKPNTDYVVNLSAIFVANGRPSCPTGGQCQIAFFVSVQK